MNVSITVRMWCSLLSPYKYPHVQYIWVIIQLNQQMKRQKSSYAEKNELIVRFYCSLVQKRAATNENNKDIVKNTLHCPRVQSDIFLLSKPTVKNSTTLRLLSWMPKKNSKSLHSRSWNKKCVCHSKNWKNTTFEIRLLSIDLFS